MIYTHVIRQGGMAVRSPVDRMFMSAGPADPVSTEDKSSLGMGAVG